MKNILFILTNYRHGGTNKSLENLLSVIDTSKYTIDVFAMEHFGPYQEMLPNCTILPKDRWLHSLIAHWGDTNGAVKLLSGAMKLMRKSSNWFGVDFSKLVYSKASKRLVNNKKYDAVIAYSEGAPTLFLASTNHSNKIAWVHCDYSSYMQLNNHPDESQIYASYKSIVCVSEYTKEVFCSLVPAVKNRTVAVHNVLNVEVIKKLSKCEIDDDRFQNDKFTIVSVGRIDSVKRFDLIPQIASKLKNIGLEFRWYLIGPSGFGDAQATFDSNYSKYQIDDCFTWLGSKDNPYPYMAKSNLLVITSKSEACPYVLNESKTLHTPVLSTNYGSIHEFLLNNENGIIAYDDKIVDCINEVISNPILYERIKSSLIGNEYKNDSHLQKIMTLLDNE